MVAGVALKSTLTLRCSVGGDVVEDDMHCELVRQPLVDQVEEAAELASPTPGVEFGEHIAAGCPASCAGQVVERRGELGEALT